MLLRLSRLSLWFAAAAAGFGLFGPAGQRGLFADGALALAGVSFVLWRSALALRRRLERASDAVPAGVPLDAASLREAEAFVARAAADAPTLDAALHRVGELLRGERGARAVRAFIVCELDGAAGLCELIAAQTTMRAPRRPVALDASPIGRALRERRICVDLPRSVVLPIVRDDRAIALLELTGIEMTIDEGALTGLLTSASSSLAGLEDRTAPPAKGHSLHDGIRERSGLPTQPSIERFDGRSARAC